jgi:arsenate reductase
MRPERLTLYHNPRCAKSRAALALLRERGLEPEVVEYLAEPLTAAQLRTLLGQLGLSPAQVARTGEAVFRQKYAGRTLTDADWIAAFGADPILIERPIAVCGERAVIGRPPQRVLELL